MTLSETPFWHQWPIIKQLVQLAQRIKIPGLQGLSLYDLLALYISGIIQGALTTRAGGIAFSLFMALFPFLLFTLTLIPFIPVDGFQENLIAFLTEVLPEKTMSSVLEVIHDIAKNKYTGLLSFGFMLSFFLMTNGVNSTLSSFESSYHIKVQRSAWKAYLISMGLALLLSLLLIVATSLLITTELAFAFLKDEWGFASTDDLWRSALHFFISMAFFLTGVSTLYYFGSHELKQRFFSPGAILTTLLFLLTFRLFNIYVAEFSNYNQLYGSIGTVLVVMLFIWLNAINLLLGFELDMSLYQLRQSRKNLTK